MQIYKDFDKKVKDISNDINVSIYLNDNLEYGDKVTTKQILDYSSFDTPKLIVNEKGNVIHDTENIKSRFVYKTTTKANNIIIFIFSSKNQNTFDNITQQLLEEMQLIKNSL